MTRHDSIKSVFLHFIGAVLFPPISWIGAGPLNVIGWMLAHITVYMFTFGLGNILLYVLGWAIQPFVIHRTNQQIITLRNAYQEEQRLEWQRSTDVLQALLIAATRKEQSDPNVQNQIHTTCEGRTPDSTDQPQPVNQSPGCPVPGCSCGINPEIGMRC